MLNCVHVCAALSLCAVSAAQGASVWVASPWEHVLRQSPSGEAAEVRITAAGNEYEPFRVIVTAGDTPLSDITVTAGALTGPEGQIGSESVALFREHYIHVFEPSYRSKAPTGQYPDALIPLTGGPADAGTATEYPGMPFTVEPNTNQAIWADVYVPEGTPAGVYQGTVRIAAGGQMLAEVPVALTVRPFSLPDTIAMRSNFGGLGGRLAKSLGLEPGSEQFEAVEDRYIDVMLRHRAVPSSLGSIWPKWTPEEGIDATETHERLRSMVQDRHVNALSVPFSYRDDPEKCKAYLRDLGKYLQDNGWLDLAYIYMKDEPNDAEEYETVRQQGKIIHESGSGIKGMCTEQTVTSNPDWGDLYGAVDIWCPLWGLYDEQTARERQALGEEIWSYTALCQGSDRVPFWQVDFEPIVFRAPFWISWHYDIRGFLYWSSIYWTEGQDMWELGPHFRERYWGEGMLLYPGTAAGIEGPVPSIRLKLIREALEDFEYMTLAAERSRAQVDEIVSGLARSFTDWEHDPATYLAARELLATLIEGR